MKPDPDLHHLFSQQRRSDQQHTPAWNPQLLRTTARRPARSLPLWVPLTAAACIILSLVWINDVSRPAADLTTALPELFTPQGQPLFANLSSHQPSDSLLPFHLTVLLP